MDEKATYIIKKSGEKVKFSPKKLITSLRRANAGEETIQQILDTIKHELYEGISTREIYNRAFQLLKKKDSFTASRYKLKKAIYELGPTGFPFERFVAALLNNDAYTIEVGKIIQGKCVPHEVDIVAKKNNKTLLMECKFHSLEGKSTDVKVPLYIASRFQDIAEKNTSKNVFDEGWVVTNTRFTKDATTYAKCANLHLLSWDRPKGNSLKERIDTSGLFPITVSNLLSKREKQFLLSRDVVLCKELLDDTFYLDHLGVSEKRKKRILSEMKALCLSK